MYAVPIRKWADVTCTTVLLALTHNIFRRFCCRGRRCCRRRYHHRVRSFHGFLHRYHHSLPPLLVLLLPLL